MRIFKTTYKDRSGKRCEAEKWYIEFRNWDGAERRLPSFVDKSQADECGRKIEKLVECLQNSESPGPALMKWLGGLPDRMRDKLLEWGVINADKVEATKSLIDHLTAYEASLKADNRDAKYIRGAISQVKRVIKGCDFSHWRDVTAERVQTFLAGLREVKKGIKHRTYNSYVVGMKSFANWAVNTGRIPASPFAILNQIDETDATERRAILAEEFRWLLAVTEESVKRYGMEGKERALVYRVAAATGLRAGELRSLTRASFNLAGDDPHVVAKSSETKNKDRARIDLTVELAGLLSIHLEGKMPASRAFAMWDSTHTAKMLRADLAEARTAWIAAGGDEKNSFLQAVDHAGQELVFHSLRHTRGVWLFEHHGAGPREVQELMRLSSLALVDRYTKSFRITDGNLIERGPDLSAPAELTKARMKATGTHGAAESPCLVGLLVHRPYKTIHT